MQSSNALAMPPVKNRKVETGDNPFEMPTNQMTDIRRSVDPFGGSIPNMPPAPIFKISDPLNGGRTVMSAQEMKGLAYISNGFGSVDTTKRTTIDSVFISNMDSGLGSDYTLKSLVLFQDMTVNERFTQKVNLNSLVSTNYKLALYQQQNPKAYEDPEDILKDFQFIGVDSEDTHKTRAMGTPSLDFTRLGAGPIVVIHQGVCKTRNLWPDCRIGDRIGFLIEKVECERYVLSANFATKIPSVKAFQFVPYVLKTNSLPKTKKNAVFLKIGAVQHIDMSSVIKGGISSSLFCHDITAHYKQDIVGIYLCPGKPIVY